MVTDGTTSGGQQLDAQEAARLGDEVARLRAHARGPEVPLRAIAQTPDALRPDQTSGDALSWLAHEIRTPLSAMHALAELLRDEPQMAAAQRAQMVGIIVSETERLSRLVDQVLYKAKIESGQAQQSSKHADLRALVELALATTSALFRARQIAVELHLPAQVSPLVADTDRLLQVILNLLSNAAKFVPVPGGRVGVSVSEDDSGLTVTVQDNGPGVSEAQQSVIFERFRQGGDASNRPQGTGLGLPISRQIVEHFGGRLWIESTPPHGACFRFRLPLKPLADG